MSVFQRKMLLPVLLAYLVSLTHAAEIAYCSPDNTGADTGFQAVYNQFQSDGSCQVKCQDSYAFAILQGTNCWCSNFAPSNQKQTDLCNDPCPGYQSDWCGSASAGLYGYLALKISPSGTIGGTTSSTQTDSSDGPSPSTAQASSLTIVTSSVVIIVSASSATASSTSAQSSTLATSPSPTPNPTPPPSQNPNTSTSQVAPSPSTAPGATEAITSITTVTGQVRTIVITPSATADPTLGHGPISSNGISKGTVVGVVVGVALGLGLIIGLIVWFCLKRKHASSSIGSTVPFGASYGSGGTSNPSHSGIPSRQVSQMSSAGLLAGKGPRIQATNYGMSSGPRSADTSSGFSNDRRSVGTDQRLNPYALYSHDEARQSNISLQDNQDYSRQLRVANPDP